MTFPRFSLRNCLFAVTGNSWVGEIHSIMYEKSAALRERLLGITCLNFPFTTLPPSSSNRKKLREICQWPHGSRHPTTEIGSKYPKQETDFFFNVLPYVSTPIRCEALTANSSFASVCTAINLHDRKQQNTRLLMTVLKSLWSECFGALVAIWRAWKPGTQELFSEKDSTGLVVGEVPLGPSETLMVKSLLLKDTESTKQKRT